MIHIIIPPLSSLTISPCLAATIKTLIIGSPRNLRRSRKKGRSKVPMRRSLPDKTRCCSYRYLAGLENVNFRNQRRYEANRLETGIVKPCNISGLPRNLKPRHIPRRQPPSGWTSNLDQRPVLTLSEWAHHIRIRECRSGADTRVSILRVHCARQSR